MAQYMHSNKGAPHSDIIAPLRALTRLHARFKWTREWIGRNCVTLWVRMAYRGGYRLVGILLLEDLSYVAFGPHI